MTECSLQNVWSQIPAKFDLRSLKGWGDSHDELTDLKQGPAVPAIVDRAVTSETDERPRLGSRFG